MRPKRPNPTVRNELRSGARAPKPHQIPWLIGSMRQNPGQHLQALQSIDATTNPAPQPPLSIPTRPHESLRSLPGDNPPTSAQPRLSIPPRPHEFLRNLPEDKQQALREWQARITPRHQIHNLPARPLSNFPPSPLQAQQILHNTQQSPPLQQIPYDARQSPQQVVDNAGQSLLAQQVLNDTQQSPPPQQVVDNARQSPQQVVDNAGRSLPAQQVLHDARQSLTAQRILNDLDQSLPAVHDLDQSLTAQRILNDGQQSLPATMSLRLLENIPAIPQQSVQKRNHSTLNANVPSVSPNLPTHAKRVKTTLIPQRKNNPGASTPALVDVADHDHHPRDGINELDTANEPGDGIIELHTASEPGYGNDELEMGTTMDLSLIHPAVHSPDAEHDDDTDPVHMVSGQVSLRGRASTCQFEWVIVHPHSPSSASSSSASSSSTSSSSALLTSKFLQRFTKLNGMSVDPDRVVPINGEVVQDDSILAVNGAKTIVLHCPSCKSEQCFPFRSAPDGVKIVLKHIIFDHHLPVPSTFCDYTDCPNKPYKRHFKTVRNFVQHAALYHLDEFLQATKIHIPIDYRVGNRTLLTQALGDVGVNAMSAINEFPVSDKDIRHQLRTEEEELYSRQPLAYPSTPSAKAFSTLICSQLRTIAGRSSTPNLVLVGLDASGCNVAQWD